jgi:hypothetical protein
LSLPSNKSEELLEMERIIGGVYEVITIKNNFLLNQWSPENLKGLIEKHAVLFLKQFGLPLCRFVSDPIINLVNIPFKANASFLDFHELCKIELNNNSRFRKPNESEIPKEIIDSAINEWEIRHARYKSSMERDKEKIAS